MRNLLAAMGLSCREKVGSERGSKELKVTQQESRKAGLENPGGLSPVLLTAVHGS